MREPRRAITAGALFRIMSDTFTARRPAACKGCRMPLPYLIDRPDDVSANWRIGLPPRCPEGCHALIVQIASELWPLYDMIETTEPVGPPAAKSGTKTKAGGR